MRKVISLTERLAQKNGGIVPMDYTFPSAFQEYLDLTILPRAEEEVVKGFEIDRMKQWSHEKLIIGKVSGEMIFGYLQFNDMLEDCIGFPELGGIYAKGPDFFETYFPSEAVFAWRGAFKTPRGRYVPYLTMKNRLMILCFKWMGAFCEKGYVALRHTESSRIYEIQPDEDEINNIYYLFGKTAS